MNTTRSGTVSDLLNVGPALAAELRAAGIDTAETLRSVGARPAWQRVRRINPERDCASSLLALEGAVRGMRWMSMDADERRQISAYAREQRLS